MMALYVLPKYVDKHPVLSQDDLNLLNGVPDLSEKMEKMRKLIEIPAEDYENRQAVCTTLHELLKQYYPDSLLLMFGSSVSGFGDKNCDVNLLFLPHPAYSNLDVANVETVATPEIPDPAKILSGETPKEVLQKFNEWSHLKFLRSVLRANKALAKSVSFIPSKSPCVKAIVNNKRVELAVSNRFVVYNSELLNFLGSLDPRVKTLVMVLRFWATKMGFIRRSYFPRYAFTMLVVFFLQNTSPPILPPVKRLTEIAGYSRVISGWETAFTVNQNLVEKSKNTKSVGELLINFFDYYWNFDFVQNIISPYFGKPLPVKDLKSSKDNRMAEFELSCLNIQDPFILSRNICKADAPKAMYKLTMLTASLILRDEANFKFSQLFNSVQYQKALDLHYGHFRIRNPKICFINLDYDCMTNLKKTSKTPQLWFERVTQAVFDVLQYGLLLECEVTDKASWSKMGTTGCRSNGRNPADYTMNGKEPQKSTPYDLELLLSVQCVLYTRTWIGRKNMTDVNLEEDELVGLSGAVRSEHAISRMLLKKNPSLDNPNPLMCLQVDCYKHSSPQISDIVVALWPLTFSKEYYQVATFLASYIPKTVKKVILSD